MSPATLSPPRTTVVNSDRFQSLALPSIAIAPAGAGKRGTGSALRRLAAAFAGLKRPVIGRIQDDRLVLDLRCLDDEAGFVAQLAELEPGAR